MESGALRSRPKQKKNDFGILIASFLVGFFVLYWGDETQRKGEDWNHLHFRALLLGRRYWLLTAESESATILFRLRIVFSKIEDKIKMFFITFACFNSSSHSSTRFFLIAATLRTLKSINSTSGENKKNRQTSA